MIDSYDQFEKGKCLDQKIRYKSICSYFFDNLIARNGNLGPTFS